MVEEENPIVKVHDYYYTKEEVRNNFAPLVHTHNTATENAPGLMSKEDKIKINNCNSYSIRLSDTDGATFDSKRFIMFLGENNKLYASVRKNGQELREGIVLFIINGVIYEKEISLQNGTYCAIQNITWNTENFVGEHHIFASYMGEVKGYNNQNNQNKPIYDQYTYCMDYCLIEMKSR